MYYKTRIKTYSRLRKTKKLGKRNLKFRNTKMRRKNNRKSSRKNKYKGGAHPKMTFNKSLPRQSQSQQYQQLSPPPRPSSTDHKQKALIINGIPYQGADIFILTKRNDTICIILFVPIDPKTNEPRDIVNMPGGRCETKHKTLEAVASQELFEESACTIKISEQEFTDTLYYNLAGSGEGASGMRRTYLVYIPDTANIETNYKNNLEKIRSNSKIHHSYSETNEMVFIPLQNLQTIIDSLKGIMRNPKSKLHYPDGCNDFDDKPRNVDWRIFNIVNNLQWELD